MTAPAIPAAPTARPLRRWILDLVATALLVGAILLGFWPTFAGGSFLPAAIGGLLRGRVVAASET